MTDLFCIQGHIEIDDENHFHLIAYNNDLVSKISWNKHTRSYIKSIFKIKSKAVDYFFSCAIVGEKYTINDEICPSFLLFSSTEIILGVLIEGSIKFWYISHDISAVESASFSEDIGLFYLNSRNSSGFYTVRYSEKVFAKKCRSTLNC